MSESNLLSDLFDWIDDVLGDDGKRRSKAIEILPKRPIQIRAAPRPYWDERGWEKKLDNDGRLYYIGTYRVGSKKSGRRYSFEGFIAIQGRIAIPYILEPPTALRKHSAWICFRYLENGWYSIHWQEPASNADEAILYMEKVLAEVLLLL